MNEAAWLSEFENCGDGIAAARTNYHNNPALVVLVPAQTAITTMCFDIGWLQVAAEITAVNLSGFAFTAMRRAAKR